MPGNGIVARFEARVRERPDALAATDGAARLTYAQLNASANRIAHTVLARAGTGPTVAVLCDHGLARVEAAVGVLKSCRGFTLLDATYPDETLRAIIAHTAASAVVADAGNAGRAASLVPDTVRVINLATLDPALPATAPGLVPDEESLAYLRHTSGSTGNPKGVIHDHRLALHCALASLATSAYAPEDRIALLNAFWLSPFWAALISGSSLHVYDLKRSGPRGFGRWMREQEISILPIYPAGFRECAAAWAEGDVFPAMRLVQLSGEPAMPSDVRLARRRFSASCTVVNGYGSSEFSQIAAFAVEPTDPVPTGALPAGWPVLGVELLTLDEDGRPLARNRRGRVAARLPVPMQGYWRNPEATARIMVADPEIPGGSLYLTGDAGLIDGAGCLHVLGRSDDEVKVRGYRLLPAEVEGALAAHEGVLAVAVTVTPDRRGNNRLVAHVVPRGPFPDLARDLRAYLARRLAAYMVPSRFVMVAELPVTAGGKIDRASLAATVDHGFAPAEGWVAPRNVLEQTLVALWREALEHEPIGIRDTFLGLGGDSLSGARLILAVEARFGTTITPGELVTGLATIEAMAQQIEWERTNRPAGSSRMLSPLPANDVADEAFGPDGMALHASSASWWSLDPETGIRRPRPGARLGRLTFNRHGFVGPDLDGAAPAQSVRMAFLGDSVTLDVRAGSEAATWPHRTGAALGALVPGLAVQCINAGMPAARMRHMAALLDSAIAPLQPDAIVIQPGDFMAEASYLARARSVFTHPGHRKTRLARRSRPWNGIETNAVAAWRLARLAALPPRFRFDPEAGTAMFEAHLRELLDAAHGLCGIVVVLTPSGRLGPDQGPAERARALLAHAYHRAHLSIRDAEAARRVAERAIVRIAAETGTLVVDSARVVPAAARNYRDISHLSAAGGSKLASAIAQAITSSDAFRALAAARLGRG